MKPKLALLLAGVIVPLLAWACSPTPAWQTCTEGKQLAMHIHPKLSIWVDGRPVEVPAGIGMEAGCTRPLHTHEADGSIHVESPLLRDYTLGEFFQVWGKELSAEQVLSYRAAGGYTIRAIAEGNPVTDLPGLVLKDGLDIIISITSPPQAR